MLFVLGESLEARSTSMILIMQLAGNHINTFIVVFEPWLFFLGK
jgi:hypothetical protein